MHFQIIFLKHDQNIMKNFGTLLLLPTFFGGEKLKCSSKFRWTHFSSILSSDNGITVMIFNITIINISYYVTLFAKMSLKLLKH